MHPVLAALPRSPLPLLPLAAALLAAPAAAQAWLDPILSLEPDLEGEHNGFGRGLAVDGDRMVVVADDWPGTPVTYGAVAVFLERDAAGTWQLDGFVESAFGASAAFAQNLDLDGVHFVASDLSTIGVYQRQGPGTWVRVATLENPAPTVYSLDLASLAVDSGSVFATGAPKLPAPDGVSGIFRWEGQPDGTWPLVQTLTPFGAPTPEAPYVRHSDVAVSAGRAVVEVNLMSPQDVPAGTYWSTTVYRFVEYELDPVTGWWQELGPFHSLALDPGHLYGPFLLQMDGDDFGYAYKTPWGTFEWRFWRRAADGTWSSSPLFPASSFPSGGSAFAFEEGRLLTGKRFLPSSGALEDAGTVILHERQQDGAWLETARWGAPGPDHHEYFGSAVAIDAGVAYGSVPFEQSTVPGGVPPESGVVYPFDLSSVGDELQCAQHAVSLATGGAIRLSLFVGGGAQAAWLLGGASGTAPGVPLSGAGVLPLVPDAYTNLFLTAPNQGPLWGTLIHPTLGVVAGVGDELGHAAVSVPPGLPAALAGVTLHHAAVVLDAATLAPTHVTPAVGTTLVL